MRDLIVSVSLLSGIACATAPASGDQDEDGSSSGSESGVETETGDPPEPEPEPEPAACPSEPPLSSAFGHFQWTDAPPDEPSAEPLVCEIVSHGIEFGFEIYELDCPLADISLPGQLRFILDIADAPGAYPFEIGQMLEFDWVSVGDWVSPEANASTVRDPDSGRLLMFDYEGIELPQGFDELTPSFYAPLTMTPADTICPLDCYEDPGLGVPPDCYCERKLDLEISAGPEATPSVIRSRSGGYLEVPGEPDGYMAVGRAMVCEDGDSDYSPTRFRMFYVAGVG